jgi:subtilase family serine protease
LLPIEIKAPNLKVSNATAPKSITLGEKFDISWIVENLGEVETIENIDEDGIANNWYDAVYISDDQVLDSKDTYLTSERAEDNAPLASGENYAVTQNVTIPRTATGSRYLLFVTDRGNYQVETDETDNVLAIPIEVNAVNLVISDVTAPSSAIVGETIDLSWTVTNNGTAAATSNWIDRVYFSRDDDYFVDPIVAEELLNGNEVPLEVGSSYTINQSVTIPKYAVGNYYLLFGTDDFKLFDQLEIIESNEEDNEASLPIEVKAPNLKFTKTTAPATAVLGKKITVSWTVENQDMATALFDWFDGVYVSDDPIFDYRSDRHLTSVDVAEQSPLEANADYTITQDITLPLNTNPGDRYLLFVADENNKQTETNQEDNVYAVPIKLVAPLVDLTITDISATTEVISGQQVEVAWTVTNQGSDPITGTWRDNVYLSGDDVFGADIPLGAFSFTGTIGVGESLQRKQVVEIPIDISGNYWFAVAADAYQEKIEYFHEDNNTLVDDQPLNIVLSKFPNLQVSSVVAPITAFSSQETVVQWTVTNNGDQATSSPYWYDRVWLSLNSSLDRTDVYLGEVVNSNYLRAGESYTNDLTVTLPLGIDGNYRFLVETDYSNGVYEYQSEGDNLAASTITDVQLTPPPDLQVTEVKAPTSAFSAQSLPLTWTVENKGTGKTLESSWYDQVYMSTDKALDSEDIFLGEFFHRGRLQARESYSRTANIILPTEVTGDYFFFVKTDAGEEVYEQAFESNNDRFDSTPTKINLTPPPDLEVESITLPDTARAGTALNIDYRVANFGSTVTPNNSWQDSFYLSKDEVFDPEVDFKLSDRTHFGALEPAENYNEADTFTLSNELEGSYYVFAETDSANEVFELDNANNRNRSLGKVKIISNPADLVISATAPTNVEAGKAIRVKWTVTNQGTGDTIANFWRDRLIVSTNSTLGDEDDLDLAIFDSTADILNPGGSYTRNELVTIPFELEGDYQLFVVTDANNQVYEAEAEDNNTANILPLTVSRKTPDLKVTQIPVPNTATSGQELTLSWTVQNFGTAKTNTNYWYEQVYLSVDSTLSEDDYFLGRTSNPNSFLKAAATYNQTRTYDLPVDLAGDYYVLVKTDAGNSVIESSENNNTTASDTAIAIGLNAVPDLIVDRVETATTAIGGQNLDLTWTVTNKGAANASGRWYDYLYLSRDQIFDPNNDIYLGFGIAETELATGESYTLTQSVEIPRGLSGSFYVLAVTDSGENIYERGGEGNNSNYAPLPVEVILPPPADLVITNIDIPTKAVVGKPIQIDYTGKNQGTDAALGSWEDSVYLSKDQKWDLDDALVGKVPRGGSADLPSGESYSGSLKENLSGVTPGDYYVLVRGDIRNQVPENNEDNNLGVSLGKVTVDVPELLLDTSTTGNSLRSGQAVYYRVDVEAGQSLLINFDSQSETAFNELYVSYGKTPTRGDFDFGYAEPFAADQEILIPNTEAGTYYILAYGNSVPNSGAGFPTGYTIEAEIIDFAVLDDNYGVGGTAGNRTIEINGNKFDRNTTAYLRSESGEKLVATNYYWVDSTRFYPTFDLTKATPGIYDVVVKNANGDEAVVDDGLEVVAGGGTQLKVDLDLPEAVARPFHDPAGRFNGYLNWFNDGINDALPPVLEVSSTAPISLDPKNISTAGVPEKPLGNINVTHLFGSSFVHYGVIEGDGPPGIILPGQGGQLPFYGAIDPNPESIITNVNLFELSDPYPWEDIKDNLQPALMTDEEFEPIWQQLIAQVGTTWGDYLEMLSRNANLLPEELLEIYSPNDILAQEMWKAQASLGTSISGSLSAEDLDIDLGGRTVIAKGTTNGEVFTALTLNDGSFIFPDLPAGQYEFSVSELLIDSDIPMSVNLTEGKQADLVIPVDLGAQLHVNVDFAAVTVHSPQSKMSQLHPCGVC